jgi:flavin reductase (DIM6/NTAB) family NADH-FMN oxidoreductase RutF
VDGTVSTVIDRDVKRCLGQMMKGVQVVAATDGDLTRAYCSHWVCQVSFEEPILMASVSPKHDTHALIASSGAFTVSILAGDQVDAGQYFSYPGRRFRYVAPEYLSVERGHPVVPGAIAWLHCEVIDRLHGLGGHDGHPAIELDHELFFARVVEVGEGRLREPPLLYSSRLGWRVTGDKAREPGGSVRDMLLARLAEVAGLDGVHIEGLDEPAPTRDHGPED